jgi:hypothetical protein
MKKILTIVVILALTQIITSCKDDEGAKLYNITVTTLFPDGLTNADSSGVTVKLLNTTTAVTKTGTTDENGVVTFKVEAGTYTISATKTTDEFVFNGISENQIIEESSLTFTVDLVAATIGGGLVIKEVYYTGSTTTSNSNYYSDQFVEIYNNSDSVIYLDGLCMAVMDPSLSSSASVWVDNSGNLLDSLPNIFHTWMWPGTGTSYPLEPRTSIVVAQDGIDHQTDASGNSNSPVNLGNANWETYAETSGKDTDSPGVPNLTCIYTTSTTSYDWLMPVAGPALIIFRLPTGLDYTSYINNTNNFSTKPGSTSTIQYLLIPKNYVIDAVECVNVDENKRYKRVPTSLDAGYVYCSGTYVSESIRRKVDKIVDGKVLYKDTNNSSEDFLGSQTPTPFVNPTIVDE